MKSIMNGKWATLLATVAMLSISTAGAADWPQFQGPDRNGISPETGLAREWPADGPKTVWSHETGVGYGGPAIRDGKVYFLDREANKRDILRCLDLETGNEDWQFPYDVPGKLSHDGTRNTPTVDEKVIYSIGPFGHFQCVDRKTGKPVWSENLETLSGRDRPPMWGVSQAPVLYKNTVIAAAQGPEAGLVALDRATGKVVWKSRGLKGKPGYVSPVLATVDGVDQIVIVTAGSSESSGRGGRSSTTGGASSAPSSATPGETAGFNAADGKELWSYTGWQCRIPIAYAVPLSDNRFLVTGGYEAGSNMIRVKKSDAGFQVEELFKTQVFGCQIQQPILHKGHLYVDSNSNSRRDGLTCVTLEGNLAWRTKDIDGAPTFDRGGILLADGLLYAVDKSGTLRMIDPNPDGYKELGAVKLLDGKEIWSTMALSDGKLVLRDHDKIVCVDLR